VCITAFEQKDNIRTHVTAGISGGLSHADTVRQLHVFGMGSQEFPNARLVVGKIKADSMVEPTEPRQCLVDGI